MIQLDGSTGNVSATGRFIPTGLWRGILNQAASAAPSAVVLVNTLGGNIVWSRTSAGLYVGTLAGAFLADKTFILSNWGRNLSHEQDLSIVRSSDDTIGIESKLVGVSEDDLIFELSLEICVYP